MYASVNGIKLYFDIEGMGLVPSGLTMQEKPACFVLHGGPGLDHSYFKPWLTPLAADLQLVYVDHRGTGRSERAPLESCTIEQMADDLEELRKLLGLESVIVLGNSFGGMLALTYAIRHPDHLSKLILVTTSASHHFWDAAARELEARGTPEQRATAPSLFDGQVTTEEDFSRWWQVMMPLYFYHRDPQRDENLIARGIYNPLVAAYIFEHFIPRFDVRNELHSIHAPSLVCSGRHDWVTPVIESEYLAEHIPNARLAMFEKSGHMPFIEESDYFADVVRDFVAEAS